MIMDYDSSGKANHGATPPGWWLRNVLGDDLFGNVTVVGLTNVQVSDAVLEHLKGYLKRLTQLQCLGLFGTRVTDTGMESLKGLTQLQWLHSATLRSAMLDCNTLRD